MPMRSLRTAVFQKLHNLLVSVMLILGHRVGAVDKNDCGAGRLLTVTIYAI